MRFPYAILTTLKYDQIRLLDETRARTEYRNFPATQKVWMTTMRRGNWRNIRTSTRTGRMVPATRVKFAVCKWTVKGRRPEETGLFYIFRCQRCVCATANRPRACRFGLREGNLHNMSIRACNTTNTHSRWKRIIKKKKTGQICKIIRQQLSDLRRAYVTKRVCIEFDVQRRETTFLGITVLDMRPYPIVSIG